jgi:hypothetical protein
VTLPFQTYIDRQGNFVMAAGHVIAFHGTTEIFPIAGGAAALSVEAGKADDSLRGLAGAGAIFGGASGRNYRVSVATGGPVADIPEGIFKEVEPKRWNSATAMDWRLEMDPGSGDVSLNDGTGVLADSAGFGTVTGTRSAGTFPNQAWTLESVFGFIRIYRGVTDTAKLIIHDASSGNSSIVHDVSYDQVALRAGIDYATPAGVYDATSDGEDDFNGSSPWSYTVTGGGLSGTLASTSYGETTYNGGNPFTVAADHEGGGELPGVAVQALAGSFSAATFAAESHTLYTEGGRSITIAGDGSAELSDGTDIVAVRAADADLLYDPSGSYVSTTYGADTYNLGATFELEVTQATTHPMAGVLYVTIERDAITDEATGTSGPHFAALMPANSSTEVHSPIATSDGAGAVTQLQLGPIPWRPQP